VGVNRVIGHRLLFEVKMGRFVWWNVLFVILLCCRYYSAFNRTILELKPARGIKYTKLDL